MNSDFQHLIFLSHADLDKPRLVPFVMHLLANLPIDVGLWVDQPDKIEPHFASNPRLVGIPEGARWRREIDIAIDQSSCVLAFWSKNLITRLTRSVVVDELDQARLLHKLVQLSLDPIGSLEIPTPYSRDQILDVHDTSNEQIARFSIAINKIAAILSKATPTSPVIAKSMPAAIALQRLRDSDAEGNRNIDIVTPGVSKLQLTQHYEPLLGSSDTHTLIRISKDAIAAVANGDFAQQVSLGVDLQALGGGTPYLSGLGAYFMGEGFRLLADLAIDLRVKSELQDKALASYQSSINKLGDDPRPLRGIARTLEVRNELDSALKLFRRAQAQCLMILAVHSPDERPEIAHESLRIDRHMIHCILEMRRTNPRSEWRRVPKTQELENLIAACRNRHRELMPLFAQSEDWWLIEWFMALVFLARSSGEVGNVEPMKRDLIYALQRRAKLMPASGKLTAVEEANVRWWLQVARENQLSLDHRWRTFLDLLEEALGARERQPLRESINDFVLSDVPPWT